jgi:hypothetical protein
MSFTDLSQLAQSQQQPPQAPGQAAPGQDPTAAPDPRSFSPLSPTNPVRTASAEVGGSGSLGDLEEQGKEASLEPEKEEKKAADEEQKPDFPPVTFPPSTYKPAAADRPPNEWGKPWPPVVMASLYPNIAPGPDIPAPHEMYDAIQSAAQNASVWAAPDVAKPSSDAAFLANPLVMLLNGLSHGKFNANFNAVGLNQLRARQFEIAERLDAATRNYQEHLQTYGTILYEEQHHIITPEEAKRRIEEYANLKQDHQTLQFLHKNGLRGVYENMSLQEAWYRQMLASNHQLKKVAGVDGDNEIARSWGYPGSSGGGLLIDPDKLPGRTGAAPEAPVTPAAPGAGEYKIIPGSFDETLQQQGLTPRAIQAVHQRFNELTPEGWAAVEKGAEKGTPNASKIYGQIGNGVMAMQNRANEIMAGPGTAQQKFQNLKNNVDLNFGSTLQGYWDYSLNADSDEAKAKGYNRQMKAWLKQLDPNWDSGNYKNLHEITEPKGDPQKLLGSVGILVQDYLNTMVNLNKIGETKTIPRKWIENMMAGKVTGVPPEYAALHNNLVAFEATAARLLGQTGATRVAILNQLLSQIGPTASAAQIRGVLQNEMAAAWANYNKYQSTWSGYSKREGLVPGLDSENFKALRAIVKQDVNTGRFPKGEDVPNQVRAADQTGPVRKEFQSEEYKDSHEPLTTQQYQALDDFVFAHQHDPDEETQRLVTKARVRMGPLLGLGRRIPQVDVPVPMRSQ